MTTACRYLAGLASAATTARTRVGARPALDTSLNLAALPPAYTTEPRVVTTHTSNRLARAVKRVFVGCFKPLNKKNKNLARDDAHAQFCLARDSNLARYQEMLAARAAAVALNPCAAGATGGTYPYCVAPPAAESFAAEGLEDDEATTPLAFAVPTAAQMIAASAAMVDVAGKEDKLKAAAVMAVAAEKKKGGSNLALAAPKKVRKAVAFEPGPAAIRTACVATAEEVPATSFMGPSLAAQLAAAVAAAKGDKPATTKAALVVISLTADARAAASPPSTSVYCTALVPYKGSVAVEEEEESSFETFACDPTAAAAAASARAAFFPPIPAPVDGLAFDDTGSIITLTKRTQFAMLDDYAAEWEADVTDVSVDAWEEAATTIPVLACNPPPPPPPPGKAPYIKNVKLMPEELANTFGFYAAGGLTGAQRLFESEVAADCAARGLAPPKWVKASNLPPTAPGGGFFAAAAAAAPHPGAYTHPAGGKFPPPPSAWSDEEEEEDWIVEEEEEGVPEWAAEEEEEGLSEWAGAGPDKDDDSAFGDGGFFGCVAEEDLGCLGDLEELVA